MVLIRPAKPEDAPAIASVHVASWRSTYRGLVPEAYLASLDCEARALQWQDWLALDLPVYVAEHAGGVVGFAAGGPIREAIAGFDAELFTLYLLETAQRQGIGRKLLYNVAAELSRRGHASMVAWVLEANASRGFYQGTGAQRVSSKELEIGGALLRAEAFGWPSLLK